MLRIALASITGALAGFVGGYFLGPELLCPNCTAAPLNGIFVAAPIGLVLGAVAGIIAARKRVAPSAFAITLVAVCIAALSIGAVLSWPEPYVAGELVDARVLACRRPADLIDSATIRWRGLLHETNERVPADWENRARGIADQSDGVVLTIQVQQRRTFYLVREPWRLGQVRAGSWKQETARQDVFARFAGADCSRYQLGSVYLAENWEPSTKTPPDTLPAILGLYVAYPVEREWKPAAPPR